MHVERGAAFQTTRWSLVVAAGATTSAESRDALAELCTLYWYPLYAYVRRAGHDTHQAEDLTQAFFARLLEKKAVRLADPQRGRFRSFLLASLRNFLSNEWDRTRSVKRGGGTAPLSLDAASAEARYGNEPAHDLSPERLYERRWALTLLELAMSQLQRQLVERGNGKLFDRLQGLLAGERSDVSYRELGNELGMSESAVKTAVHRLRQRFGALVRGQVAQTVSSTDQVDDELNYLFSALEP
jgi:RNA polymerase sigma factor (sigma-70 family)